MSLLVICGILGLFVNILSANDKYFVCYRKFFLQPIQMQLSKKQNTFFQFMAPFLKFTSTSKHFDKKDDLHTSCISQITDGQIYVLR